MVRRIISRRFIVITSITAVVLILLLKLIELYYEKTHPPVLPDKTPEQLALLTNEEKYNYYMFFVRQGNMAKGFIGCKEIVELAPKLKELLLKKFENDSKPDTEVFVISLGIQKALGKDAEDYFGNFLEGNNENLIINSIATLANMRSEKYYLKIATFEKHKNIRIRFAVAQYYSYMQDLKSKEKLKSMKENESDERFVRFINSSIGSYRTENDFKNLNSCAR